MADLAAYTVTAVAGPNIAGKRHGGTGTTVNLTAEQAAYELLVGSIVPAGQPVPPVVAPAPIVGTDVVTVSRNGSTRELTADQLKTFIGAGSGSTGGLSPIVASLIFGG